MPKNSEIGKVRIYHNSYIVGFSFFGKLGQLIFEIGYTWSELVKTVFLAENEVIVGVVAKLSGVNKSMYTDFQFQIATKYD